ncbi:hypothetical protein [Fulvivirga sediminis]|uniref:Outer membrane protein beta-barrel domain-containing protein n=1 Tax=Fulvivirga sediminis TaxID=2803949 RepID=A0A937F9D0_9BACT|nr:hypothetical protein [Fulvivirga sediminis]MBL3657631.1 hypothetical protein [Fulvivirga sediminis]
MKKIIPIFLMLLSVSVWAQDASTEEGKDTIQFRPIAGEKTLELQFAPFGDDPISINGIKMRWFKSERKAFRLTANLGFVTSKDITQQEDDDLGLKELASRNSNLDISLKPGFEKHLKGTEKLSPYFGGEVDLMYRRTKMKGEFQEGESVYYNEIINEGGFFRVGLNAIAGFDFYVAKKLYLGAEVGYGVSFRKDLSVKLKSNYEDFEEPEPAKDGFSFAAGAFTEAQIRLGYTF